MYRFRYEPLYWGQTFLSILFLVNNLNGGWPIISSPLVEPVLSGLFHSLAGKGRVGGREGKVNDAEVGGT